MSTDTWQDESPADVHAAPVAAGIEIAESATRFTLTFGMSLQARRWRIRLAAPASPEVAATTIAGHIIRATHELAETTGAQPNQPPRLGVALANAEVDARNGIVRALRQASGWQNVPFAELLAQHTGSAVQLATDTNAAAVAEAHLGAGRALDPTDTLLYVLLARGVTSSYVVGGRYVEGAHGAEGQLGHWIVREAGPRCSCGAYGHLEPLASAQALVRNLIGRASDSDESTAAMLRVTGGRAEAMTAAQVVRLATEGDPAAHAVLAEALDALAPALANLSAVLDPATIVVGGPLALAGEGFLAPLRARLGAVHSPTRRLPALRPAALEPVAALVGARLLATSEGILH